MTTPTVRSVTNTPPSRISSASSAPPSPASALLKETATRRRAQSIADQELMPPRNSFSAGKLHYQKDAPDPEDYESPVGEQKHDEDFGENLAYEQDALDNEDLPSDSSGEDVRPPDPQRIERLIDDGYDDVNGAFYIESLKEKHGDKRVKEKREELARRKEQRKQASAHAAPQPLGMQRQLQPEYLFGTASSSSPARNGFQFVPSSSSAPPASAAPPFSFGAALPPAAAIDNPFATGSTSYTYNFETANEDKKTAPPDVSIVKCPSCKERLDTSERGLSWDYLPCCGVPMHCVCVIGYVYRLKSRQHPEAYVCFCCHNQNKQAMVKAIVDHWEVHNMPKHQIKAMLQKEKPPVIALRMKIEDKKRAWVKAFATLTAEETGATLSSQYRTVGIKANIDEKVNNAKVKMDKSFLSLQEQSAEVVKSIERFRQAATTTAELRGRYKRLCIMQSIPVNLPTELLRDDSIDDADAPAQRTVVVDGQMVDVDL